MQAFDLLSFASDLKWIAQDSESSILENLKVRNGSLPTNFCACGGRSLPSALEDAIAAMQNVQNRQ